MSQFNINRNNGLPSNYVYYMMKDRLGYLWLATTKGVVKYNGYEAKTFDLSSGMANDDVWYLYEDGGGRIWLSSISYEMGYIKQGKYRKVVFRNPGLPIFPTYYTDYAEGIRFITDDRKGRCYLCRERKDSVTCTRVDSVAGIYLRPGSGKPFPHITGNGELIVVSDTNVYRVRFCSGNTSFEKIRYRVRTGKLHVYNSWLIPYETDQRKTTLLYHLDNSRTKTLTLHAEENLHMVNEYQGQYYFVTNKNVYRLNDSMDATAVIPFDQLLEGKITQENKVVSVIEDDFWGRCIATSTHGLYIDHQTGYHLQKINEYDLTDYQHVGHSPDGTQYWWNKVRRTLASWRKNGTMACRRYQHIREVRKILPYTDRVSLMLTNEDTYQLHENGLLEPFVPVNNTIPDFGRSYAQNLADCCILSPEDIFLVPITSSLVHYRMLHNSATIESIDGSRFKAVVKDRFRKKVWAYGDNIILVTDGRNNHSIRQNGLRTLGIKKIERILLDSLYGTAFVKDHDRLFVYVPARNTCKTLFNEYNLSNAQVALCHNILIVAGKFGILFSSIRKDGNMQAQLTIWNKKSTRYNYVNDLQLSGDQVLLNTDKGIYTVALPSDSQLRQAVPAQLPYQLNVTYNDSTFNIGQGDTLVMDQKNRVLHFDVVNPNGTGALKYRYLLEGTEPHWVELNGDELYLPRLTPGTYNTISLIASDDAWRSRKTDITIVLKPYWWQTPSGRKLSWVLGAVLVAALVLSVVYITRKIVARKHLQRQLRLQLELKSIYAQINPHFIFNTLSTGLNFIRKKKMDEAYNHISAFSDLLRSYIRSSRNKFLTIAEEIENLENYIQLQLTRFAHKFDYRIVTGFDPGDDDVKIPSLLLQPLVENAINHGLFHKEEKGHLTIEFRIDKLQNTLTCIIDDDGIGRTRSKEIYSETPAKAQSYGSELVTELINIFNTYEHMNISIRYIDKEEPLSGTTVVLTIQNLIS